MKHARLAFAALPVLMISGLTASAFAQEPNPTAVAPGARKATVIAEGQNGTFVMNVKVVQRNLDAVNYLNRSGSTNISFAGTNLAQNARGEAKVESQTGKTKVSVKFEGLTPANGYGPEYLTYVLWAISADGRPQNLGELELAGNKASLDNVSVGFQSFGMIVTAEPYYAVSQPSDVVVLENVAKDHTQGIHETVNVHYSLMPKGIYAPTDGPKSQMHPITDREHTPLALFEAYNAQRIAEMAGADKYAPDIMQEVNQDLTNAQALQDNKHRDVKMEFTFARQAVQRAEDARITSIRKEIAEKRQNEIDARKQADAQAQQSALQAQQAQLQAAQAQAQADAAAAAKARADADRAKADADAAQARLAQEAANRRAADATADAAALKAKLLAQLNSVFQTRETARGLVIEMGDVLFDTGRATIKPDTKVPLAKIATILELYPSLKVQVEGYTDSVGGDAYNQKLSESRADGVHDFLVGNGVPAENVTATGYGKADPVADNSTAAGRKQNRRVEMVVSGNAIGVPTTSGPSADAAGGQQ